MSSRSPKPERLSPRRDPLQVNLRWLVRLILFAVILPTTVLTGVGAGLVFAQEKADRLVLGVLLVAFAISVFSGAVLLLVLAGRGARLARVQETFLSRMSHELLTPVAGIRLHAQLLERQNPSPDMTESLKAIGKEVKRLQDLVERALSWRQVHTGKHLYQRVRTTPQEVIDRVLQRASSTDRLRVRVRHPETPFLADPEALAEALFNLVQNALKYSPVTAAVDLNARRFGRRVVFAVSDRGPGLPAPLNQLCEPFFRKPPGERDDPGGTGLGLTIARQIARDNGGHLGAALRRGGGSRFYITLVTADRR